MLGVDRRSIQNFDWTLLALIGLLMAAGLVNLYSATWVPGGLSDEMRRQLLDAKMLNLRVQGRMRISEDDMKSAYRRAAQEERKRLSFRAERSDHAMLTGDLPQRFL